LLESGNYWEETSVMKKEMVVTLLIAAMAFVFMPMNAHAAVLNKDFCAAFTLVITNPLLPVLIGAAPEVGALLGAFTPPTADLNGNSIIDTDPQEANWPIGPYPFAWDMTKTPPELLGTIIYIQGNGMRDCDSELGVLSSALANETLDLSSHGGITHQIALDAWNHNHDTMAACVGTVAPNNYWTLLLEQPGGIVPGLADILLGYCTMGGGEFIVGTITGPGTFVADPNQTTPNENSKAYKLTGAGGFIAGILKILEGTGFLADASLATLEHYTLLPQYLAKDGDADGDGCTNGEEYAAYGTTATTYVNAALSFAVHPEGCVGTGEGEGEGEVQCDDTDKDGLCDIDEINRFGTNPNNPDSDGGGVWDGVEVSLGMNPNDAGDDHLVPTTNHYGLALLGLMIGAAGVVAVMKIRKSRATA